MPISEKQLAANKANAAKSTGAKTIGGKYNSSRNAITHGFLATSIVLPGESRERFLELLASLINEFEPATANELNLVETMAVCRWRTLRCWTLEAASLTHEQLRQADSATEENGPTCTMLALRSLAGPPNSQENLSRYEVRFDRQYHRAADSLLRLKAKKRIRSHFQKKTKGKPDDTIPNEA